MSFAAFSFFFYWFLGLNLSYISILFIWGMLDAFQFFWCFSFDGSFNIDLNIFLSIKNGS